MVRLKNRYLVALVTDTRTNKPANLPELSMYSTIMSGIRFIHGAFGDGAVLSGTHLKYINRSTGLIMIRARRGPHRLVASALPLITECRPDREADKAVKIRITTLYTGASIKQSLMFIKRYQMEEYHKAAVHMTDEERQELFKLYMNYQL